MWEIWQGSPEYGCDDNPSYEWFCCKVEDGHIVQFCGPFASYEDAVVAVMEPPKTR